MGERSASKHCSVGVYPGAGLGKYLAHRHAEPRHDVSPIKRIVQAKGCHWFVAAGAPDVDLLPEWPDDSGQTYPGGKPDQDLGGKLRTMLAG